MSQLMDNEKNTASQQKHLNFNSLDDDSILEVMSRLSIPQTFAMKGIFGSRVDNLANQRIARCRTLAINLRTFPKYTHQQLMQIGLNLRVLKIQVGFTYSNDEVLKILVPLLESAAASQLLSTLDIKYINFDTSYLREIVKVAVQLQSLDLSFCDLTDNLLGELLQNCFDLKELKLLGNYQLTGDSLLKLPKEENGDYILTKLTIEIQENWHFNIYDFAEKYLTIQIVAFTKGRNTFIVYNNRDEPWFRNILEFIQKNTKQKQMQQIVDF